MSVLQGLSSLGVGCLCSHLLLYIVGFVAVIVGFVFNTMGCFCHGLGLHHGFHPYVLRIWRIISLYHPLRLLTCIILGSVATTF